MDTRQEEVVVNDPATGTTQVSQTTQHLASQSEVVEAKAAKRTQVIWYIVGILDTLLILRMIFLLLGAHSVGFATALYALTDPLVAPFRGIFASPALTGSYFDTAALLAIVFYTLLGWGISALINVLNRPAPANQ